MLKVKNLRKKFTGESSSLFGAVNLELKEGNTLIVRGQNGIGKTTLLRCLSGYLNCSFDELTWKGKSLRPQTVGFASNSDQSFFPKLMLRENIKFFQRFHRSGVDMTPLIAGLGLDPYLEKPFQTCSTGIRKRMNILRAFLKSAPLILLDEPFANMDPDFCERLSQLLVAKQQLDKTTFIITSNESRSVWQGYCNSMELKKGENIVQSLP